MAIEYILGGLSLGLLAKQVEESKAAAKEVEEQNDLAKARQAVEESRNIKRAVAASRVAQAQAQAQAQVAGTTEASSTAGAIGSEVASTGGNIAFAQQIGDFQQQVFDSNIRENRARFRAQRAGTVSNVLAVASGHGKSGEVLGQYLNQLFSS